MEKITAAEFLIRQPSYPEPQESDPWYLRFANELLQSISAETLAKAMPGQLLKRIALTIIDYVQDIVADCGLWRAFVDANRSLYGWAVPFHPEPETYVDFELNREDVRFLVWYAISMLWEEKRDIYPHDPELLSLADSAFSFIEAKYEEAPDPLGWHLARGLEFSDPEDHKSIANLARWLFLHSYLLTPAYSLSLSELMGRFDMKDPDVEIKLNEALDDAMYQDTTGPLALFTPEWVYLMLERKLPAEKVSGKSVGEVHPYYEAFTKFTGGREVMFFKDYADMNRFFIDALGWAEGEEHLAQAKGADDYVLMVSRGKGMLMARDVARCLKAPDNPLYDKSYAEANDFDLLTVRGRCPADLLRYALRHNWLPDARFPGTEDTGLVKKYSDMIARCYLQFYYRD